MEPIEWVGAGLAIAALAVWAWWTGKKSGKEEAHKDPRRWCTDCHLTSDAGDHCEYASDGDGSPYTIPKDEMQAYLKQDAPGPCPKKIRVCFEQEADQSHITSLEAR